MKPTQEQIEKIWSDVADLFIKNGLYTKQDVIDYAEEASALAYDVLYICLDVMSDSSGNLISIR